MAFFPFGSVSGQMLEVPPATQNTTVSNPQLERPQREKIQARENVERCLSEQFPEFWLHSLRGNRKQSREPEPCLEKQLEGSQQYSDPNLALFASCLPHRDQLTEQHRLFSGEGNWSRLAAGGWRR